MVDDNEVEKLTHRCPRCAGTSAVTTFTLSSGGVRKPCPVCTVYGQLGLVPYVVAIETSLLEEVSEIEQRFRAVPQRVEATLRWLLEDKPLYCPPAPDGCGGSGFWVNPRNALDKRTCFKCSGSGVRR